MSTWSSTASSSAPPPTTQTSLRGQKVIDEEAYVSSLSALIQRDFFPGLPRLSAENEYLAALQALEEGHEGAEQRLRTAEAELDRLNFQQDLNRKHPTKRKRSERAMPATPRHPAPGSGPPIRPLDRGWDSKPIKNDTGTPRHQRLSRDADVSGPQASRQGFPEGAAPDITHHSLSSFQLAYTSEDNAAFLNLLRVNNERRRQRQAWSYQKEQSNNTRRKLILDAAAQRADEGYARSVLNLPMERRRKLITTGKLADDIIERVQQLEKPEDPDVVSRLLTKDHGSHPPARRTICAASEAAPDRDFDAASLSLIQRAMSTSPIRTSLKPLRHSLDPTSEILMPETEPTVANATADAGPASSRTRLNDPDRILNQRRPRPAAATSAGWKFSARNALFFGSDADISSLDKASSSLPEHQASPYSSSTIQRLFHVPQSLKSKTNFHNTALPSQGLFPDSKYGGASHRADGTTDGSVAGQSLDSSNIASDIDGGSEHRERFEDQGLDLRLGPTVNGYVFVTPYQSPVPSERGVSQSMPGGQQQRRLLRSRGACDASDKPGFAVPPNPRRDEIAHSLAANKSGSATARQFSSRSAALRGETAVSRRSEMLSPAAQSLLTRSTQRTSLGGSTPARASSISIRTPSSSQRGGDSFLARMGKRGWRDDTPTAAAAAGKRSW